MAARENSSEKELELGKGALFYPLYSTLFSKGLCLMTLKEHDGNISLGGRTITQLRFIDDNDCLATKNRNQKLYVIVLT